MGIDSHLTKRVSWIECQVVEENWAVISGESTIIAHVERLHRCVLRDAPSRADQRSTPMAYGPSSPIRAYHVHFAARLADLHPH